MKNRKADLSNSLGLGPLYPQVQTCTWKCSTRTIIRSIRTPWTGPGTQALNFTVRQENGTFNALGAVKIDMANSYSVYMHDTNQRSLFSDDYRFDSHGCSRVDNVRNLADWLLYEEMPKWNRAGVDAAIATGAREEVTLPKKVPVACIYLTAWMTRDQSSSATTSMPRTSSSWSDRRGSRLLQSGRQSSIDGASGAVIECPVTRRLRGRRAFMEKRKPEFKGK
jgi:hypothetical protein